MSFSFLHHYKNHADLFGLLTKRALYRGENEGHLVREDEVKRSETGNLDELKADNERVKKILEEETADYNRKYSERNPSVPHERKIELNFDDLAASEAGLNEIIASIEAQRNPQGELSNELQKQLNEANDIKNTLPRLKDAFDDLALLETKIQEGDDEKAKEYAQRSRLRRKYEREEEGARTLKSWQESPFYEKVSAHFDLVSNNKEFASLWKTPEGMETEKGKESRNLFMAILAQETNNFKTPLIFGNDFGDDYKENIKNYPFIYNEWLKRESGIGLSMEGIEDAENETELLESRMGSVRTMEEIILVGGESSGMEQVKVDELRTEPKDEAWAERADLIEHFIQNLKDKAGEAEGNAQKAKSYETLIEELKVHKQYANAKSRYFELLNTKEGLDRNFTRGYFSHESKQKMAIELAMKKFQKTMEMVDKPMGDRGGNWQRNLHPTVRRLLVASFYRSEADNFKENRDGKMEFDENISGVKADMIAAMSQSEYFNANEIGKNMDADHRYGLKVIDLGFQLDDFIKNAQEPIQVVDLYIKRKGTTDKAELAILANEIAKFPAYIGPFGKMSEADLKAIRAEYDKNVVAASEYMKAALAFLKNPSSTESKAFLEEIKTGKIGESLQNFVDDLSLSLGITAPKLDTYERVMQGVEINFNALDLSEVNDMKFFERLGIHLEGIYPVYIEKIKEHPEMSIDHWNEYLLSKDPLEFKKLTDFLEKILPEDIAGGKEDFLASLKSLHEEPDLAKYLSNPEIAGDHAVTFAVLTGIKEHLRLRREAAAYSDRGEKEIAAKLNGMSIGEKASKFGEGLWNMLWSGPMANRIGAGILCLGFLKAARAAMKGDTPGAKALQIFFAGGAMEIVTQQLTGRGILDRIGLNAIAGAMEGTYEGVLLQQGRKFMDQNDINDEQHGAALRELNDVPMADLIEWYETTDNNGMPHSNQPDKFPSQIKIGRIVKGTSWKEEQKSLEGRRIVKRTIEQFLGYVGNKDNERGPEHGFNVVKERYVTMVKDPKHKAEKTTFWQNFYEAYGDKPNEVTWQLVMRSEIDPQEVEFTKNKTLVGELETTAQEIWEGSGNWIRENVYNSGSGYAEVFLTNLGETARSTSETLGTLAETLGTKLHFTKETVSLWYNSNKYEMKRLANQHWEIAVEGAKLPFKVIYGVDQLVMPFVLSKIQQIDAVLSNTQNISIKDRELELTDIVSDPATEGFANVELNPNYTYFGEYQVPFKEAFEAPDKFKLDASNIGYYISDVSTVEAGINLQDETYRSSPNNVDRALIAASREKAIDEFEKRGMGMTRKEIATYLYEIHTIDRTTDPPKKFIFWRLPLPGSAELQLRRSGLWADFTDPNRLKDRVPFMMDPSKTRMENFMAAMSLDMDPVRYVAAGTMGYAAQVPRLAFANIETLGVPIKWIARKLQGAKDGSTEAKQIDEAMDIAFKRPESQRIVIDEFFTSGKDKEFSLSEFYKNPFNSTLYDWSLAYAQQKGKRLYLGLLEGEKGYEGTMYLKAVEEQPFVEIKKFYEQIWSQTEGRKPDPKISAHIDKKIAGK